MKQARLQTPTGIVSGRYHDDTVTTANGVYTVGRDGQLTVPCTPSALYCVGRNFTATLDQMDYDRPSVPDFFIKPPAALVGPAQPVRYPQWCNKLTYAGELAAVVDRRCRDIEQSAVPDIIRGYTILNDIDALDQEGRTARKAFDTSAPLGPWIETEIDPHDITMETLINGETRQSATTKQMIFDPYEIVSFLSRRFTLRPGDIISFGSPANPGTIEPGDDIAVTYDGVGTLRNNVIETTDDT
ncbi:MAG: 2-keto-4-pentenoate hydratase/2-oxohepta-3-ene-1,7-dioic acid hydratase (catechol pathway) [Haloquadratum walsbyi J07HQW1]|jgi:2-keto-4-pentenoate hydratase/2-oxohepta-3-ene-1,7-dioic acid hydratase (catechol pathway)|uniref:2-keto-4-pentenoate hydratase/2-oxohepta-3-ene-1,7-dioic acid hydratase (Catechol pathway) n=1 Tax=Haloquadratum walsbyi J07HQW1 TaxID=1238424 RepID=U1N3T1_9EURY|nr:MAG: 2-keto-4-pentenoate hydratase/2-oxohepta-3-ene-1,7-dioic acid hydratase (catechol pathway) [Haloquadratum walsbyi J07HQW1]